MASAYIPGFDEVLRNTELTYPPLNNVAIPVAPPVVEEEDIPPVEEEKAASELPGGEDMEVKAAESETASTAAAEGEDHPPHLPNTWGPCPPGHVGTGRLRRWMKRAC